MANGLAQSILGILCTAIFLLAGCGDRSVNGPESRNPKSTAHDQTIEPIGKLPEISSAAKPSESAKPQAEVPEKSPPDLAEEEPPKDAPIEEVEWGQEINLAEMIAKAKSGEIREIQWHVLPNILRAQDFDDRIFHLKNENKGVDLRNTLISAGVQIGKDGITFQHVF